MDNELISEYNHFVATIQQFDRQWLNQYFDTIRKLIEDIGLSNESPQLAMSVIKDKNLHVNIGQRWITKPFFDGNIGLILPLESDTASLQCQLIGYFKKSGMDEMQWVSYSFKNKLTPALYTAWQSACETEVKRVKTKSGFRKFHSSLLYDVVIKTEAREELFKKHLKRKVTQ